MGEGTSEAPPEVDERALAGWHEAPAPAGGDPAREAREESLHLEEVLLRALVEGLPPEKRARAVAGATALGLLRPGAGRVCRGVHPPPDAKQGRRARFVSSPRPGEGSPVPAVAPVRAPSRGGTPHRVERGVEGGPPAARDLEGRPERDPHFVRIGYVDVGKGGSRVDLVAEAHRNAPSAEFPGEAGQMSHEVRATGPRSRVFGPRSRSAGPVPGRRPYHEA